MRRERNFMTQAGQTGLKSDKARNSKRMYTDYPYNKFGYDRTRLSSKFLDLLIDVKDKKNKNVYDIGCGGGYWFDVYEKQGFSKENIVGLDQSTSAVKIIKEKGYTVYEGDALNLPFADEVSDITICNGVIHHTVDSRKAFSELCRITKNGGEIMVSVYNIWHPYYFFVHKLSFPLRYAYWNITKSVFPPVYLLTYGIIQITSLLIYLRLQKHYDVKRLLMDEVFNPVVELFSLRKLKRYGVSSGLTFITGGYYFFNSMLYARFTK
jgi:SAM-dependent methyltransferase